MSDAFPTLRREAAALRLTKPQIDKLVAEARYDHEHGVVAHPKVHMLARLLTAADEHAQRLRDAAIADCLPARLKASSTSYAPGPMTPPRAKVKATPDTDQPSATETQASFAQFWRSLNNAEPAGDDQPEPPAPAPTASTKPALPPLDTEAADDPATGPIGQFTEFWRSVDAKPETDNSRFWKSLN